MLNDGDSDSIEPGVLILFEFLEFAVREISRMRVEGGKHPLDRRLGSLFVINIARVITCNGGNRLVVVFLNIANNSIGIRLAWTRQSAKFSRCSNNSAKRRRQLNNDTRDTEK